jgi:AcrR family transcriptional regulator
MAEEKKTRKNNKENIELIALDLFARYGYKAVSVRDICNRLGLRESAIYYHYKNKQDILDSLYHRIDELIDDMKFKFAEAFDRADEVPEDAMCSVAVGMMKGYLLNPIVYKIISMLTIERLSDAAADQAYHRLVFELPLKQDELVFSRMIERQYIKDNNPAILAQEYYAVIYFAFQKNCIGTELLQENINKAEKEIVQNIRDLYQKMK